MKNPNRDYIIQNQSKGAFEDCSVISEWNHLDDIAYERSIFLVDLSQFL